MFRRGLVDSRETARQLIVDKKVLVGGSFANKPARLVEASQSIKLVGERPPFVSRAGKKLSVALKHFSVPVSGKYCLDVGSSTGGFSDCLLQRGAAKIVAVDVGTNQLHEKIRSDERVDVREQTDIRTLKPDYFDAPFDLVVADVSFISLRLILEPMLNLAHAETTYILLIKPQFEAGKAEASKARGVIDSPEIWHRVLHEVVDAAQELGLRLSGLERSSILGTKGNVEFVSLFESDQAKIRADSETSETLIDAALGAEHDEQTT